MNGRDYNSEIEDNERKYAYGFDFDVMHPYMLRTFSPYLSQGSVLELGPFQGAFTSRLIECFQDITCVEASIDAIKEAQMRPELHNVSFINSLFENTVLDRRYENIFLIHVLEHLNDRVALLRKIRDEWLSDEGHLFIACPNANAASRRIAVNMGIVESPEAVTPAEYEHGHRVTYTLETLEEDITVAGLRVIKSGGIFFKALANFQWDRLMQTDIINQDYLDGCYKLGEEYPDLCSSIYFICKK